VRVWFHAAIARMAHRASPALPRDKVYGAGFHPQGERIFDGPGAEQAQLFDVLRDAASESPFVEELEVLGLEEATVGELMQTLRACGAEEEECQLAAGILAHAGGRVPFVDDAGAFLSNFQLQPVDRSLMHERRNFFRAARRYFVLDEDGRQSLDRLLKKRGLEARTVARQVKGDTPRLTLEPPESLEDLFRLDPDARPLDAFEILPRLRNANRTRLDSALEAPAGDQDGETGETLLRFRKQMGEARPWLRRALATAVREHSSWQAWWAAMLLSDAGGLAEPETTLLLDVVADSKLSDLARTQARLTLARSSVLAPDRYWESAPPSQSTHHMRRATLVASSFLAKRHPEIWEKTKDREAGGEPQLTRLLSRKLQEKGA
jgi:hypothetical protein